MTQKSKAIVLALIIMVLTGVTGCLCILFLADTAGIWIGAAFAVYGYIRFGIDLGHWIAKDAPQEKKPSKKAVASDREERAAAWRKAVLPIDDENS